MFSASANESARATGTMERNAKDGRSFSIWRREPVYRFETAGMAGVRSFRILSDDVDIRMKPSNGGSDSIGIRLTGRASRRIACEIGIETRRDGDTLVIVVQVPGGLRLFEWNQLELTVELPSQHWDTIQIAAKSGDIQVSSIKASTVSIISGSGNLQAADLKLADQLELRTGSGDLVLERIEAERAAVETGSGDVRLKDISSAVYAAAGSGNIRLEKFKPAASSELKTGSGDVLVSLASGTDHLAVDFHSGSGDASIQTQGFVYQEQSDDESHVVGAFGSGDVRLTVRTGSGDFILQ